MNRRIISAALASLVVLGNAYGAGQAQSAPASAKPTNLVMWIPGSGENSDKGWTMLKDQFIAANPNTTIEYSLIPWGEYFTKLNAAFAGGLAPDVYGLGFGQLGPVQASGSVLPLDDYLKDWDGWTDIPKDILDVTVKDGKHYGIMMPDLKIFWYRKDLFDAKGLKAPTTPEEILQAARALTTKKDGKIEFAGISIASTNGEQDYFQAMLMFGGNSLWDQNAKPSYNTPVGIKTAKYLAQFFQEGLSFRADEHSLAGSMMENGLSAMEIQSYGAWVNFEQKLKGKYAAMPMPGKYSMVGATFLCAYDKTKSPVEATNLLKHLLSKESQRVIFETEGRIPSRRSNKDYFVSAGPFNGVIYEALQNTKAYGPMNPYFFDYLKYFRAALESVYYGKATAENAFALAEKEYLSVIK